MARQERPKEDLVRDATAFGIRVELRRSENDPNWIFVGLREDGGGSIYFGDDEFYAFNSRNELRRAFVNGRLLKAENYRLVAMRRERSENESVLAAETLSREEQERLIQRFEASIGTVIREIHAENFTTIRSAGNTQQDIVKVISALAAFQLSPSIIVAERPNAD